MFLNSLRKLSFPLINEQNYSLYILLKLYHKSSIMSTSKIAEFPKCMKVFMLKLAKNVFSSEI